MRVALRGLDRHPGRFCDFLERIAHGVLEHDHLRLARGDPGERVAELASELGHPCRARRIVGGPCREIVAERLPAPAAAALRRGAAPSLPDTAPPRCGTLRAAGAR